MEEELKCPVCHCLFRDPVMLPCHHNVCYHCAENLIMKSSSSNTEVPQNYNFNKPSKPSVGHETDKMSCISEAVLSDSDSGYSGGSGTANSTDSQPSPPVLTPNVSAMVATLQGSKSSPTGNPPSPQQTGISLPPLPESVSCLTCPLCHRTLFLDERGAKSLNCNAMLKSIVDRYHNCEGQGFEPQPQHPNNQNQTAKELCQLCPSESPQKAVTKCVQCAVLYCSSCREKCHPARGPLAQHKLVTLGDSKPTSRANDKPIRAFPGLPSKPILKNGIRLTPCPHHPSENTSIHCETCRLSLCVQCNEDGKHKAHEVKAIGALYRAQKGQLSQQMSALSNKARQAKDLVIILRGTQDEIEKNSSELEARTVAQCDNLIEAVQRKKDELLQKISREKELKSKTVREQTQQCTLKLRQTTGLLEYCIEVMKNNDAAAFLQTSQSLIERVACTEKQWTSRHLVPKVTSQLDLELQTSPLAVAIEKVDFLQIKVPDKPCIRIEEKSSKNNTVTLSWVSSTKRPVDGHKLEMDDGNNGPFREVYCGGEVVCTVDGLHFNSVYRARLRAYNKAGSSPYSEILHLQTSEVASFQLDPKQSHSDIQLSNNNSTVTSRSFETRVALGKIGFSRGIHYWEFSVDRFENSPDPAFGVARCDVDKEILLGKDAKSWAMYADESRNWILHDNQHFKRTDTGVKVGSRVGILLDIARSSITFFIDGKIQGSSLALNPIKSGSPVLFYPAISLNQNVQVTLRTGLKSPISNHPDPQFRKRIQSAPDSDLPPRRSPSTPQFKTQHSYDGSGTGRHVRGPPPPPPLRRGGSSGNVSIKSEGEISTASDPVPERSFKSFFRKR